jgi:hypothetical protein
MKGIGANRAGPFYWVKKGWINMVDFKKKLDELKNPSPFEQWWDKAKNTVLDTSTREKLIYQKTAARAAWNAAIATKQADSIKAKEWDEMHAYMSPTPESGLSLYDLWVQVWEDSKAAGLDELRRKADLWDSVTSPVELIMANDNYLLDVASNAKNQPDPK